MKLFIIEFENSRFHLFIVPLTFQECIVIPHTLHILIIYSASLKIVLNDQYL